MSFEAYLDNFNREKFASDIVLATNDPHEQSLDLSTPLKRVQFDLKEVEKQIKQVASSDYGELVEHFESWNKSKDFLKQISPSLNQVRNSHSRLHQTVVSPYEEVISVHAALKRLHQTCSLLRNVIYFIHIIEQLEEIWHTNNLQAADASSKSVLAFCKTLKSLQEHRKRTPSLSSLKITRDYDTHAREMHLVEVCRSSIRERGDIPSQSADVGKYLHSLYLLSPSKLSECVGSFIQSQAAVSVNYMTSTLTSPKNFEATLKNQVALKGKSVGRLCKVLQDIKTENGDLLSICASHMETSGLVSLFWREVARNFEPNLRRTLNRGGPVAKTLRTYKDDIVNSIPGGVLESSFEPFGLSKDGLEVRMMLNSFLALNTK